jgi:hypothetical protein
MTNFRSALALSPAEKFGSPLLTQKAISYGAAYGPDAHVGLSGSRPDFATAPTACHPASAGVWSGRRRLLHSHKDGNPARITFRSKNQEVARGSGLPS